MAITDSNRLTFLINYAHNSHKNAQKRNTKTGIELAGFDKAVEFGYHNLDTSFRQNNAQILAQSRGAGYWLWKPYIIWYSLNAIPENSILFYCDSGAEFIGSASASISLLESLDQPLLCYEHSGEVYEKHWTKGDVYHQLSYPEEGKKHLLASYIMFKANLEAKQFAWEWLSYAQDPYLITDLPSRVPNNSEFRESRHDQSLFSVLCHKHNFLTFRDPSQWGPVELTPPDVVARSTYDTWITNDRRRD